MRVLGASTALVLFLSLLGGQPCLCDIGVCLSAAAVEVEDEGHDCCRGSDDEDHRSETPSGCPGCAMPGVDCGQSSSCGGRPGEEGVVDRDERLAQDSPGVVHDIKRDDRLPVSPRVFTRGTMPMERRSVFTTVMLC